MPITSHRVDLLPDVVEAQAMFLQANQLRPAFEHLLARMLAVSQSEFGFIAVGPASAGQMRLDHVVTLASDTADERRPFEESVAVVLRWFSLDDAALRQLAEGRPVVRAATPEVRLRQNDTELPRLQSTLVVPFRGGEGIGLFGLANRPFGYAGDVAGVLEPVRVCCGALIASRWPSESAAEASVQQRVENDLLRFCAVTSDLLCVARKNGSFERLNPAWSHTLGFDADELRALGLRQLLHPDDRESTLQTIAALAPGTPAARFHCRCRCKDGGYAWLEWSAVAAGVTGLIYGAARDVTQHRDTMSELADARAVHRAMFDGSACAVIFTETNGTIKTLNVAAERMLAWDASELTGQNLARLHDPSELAARAGEVSEARRSPVPPSFDVLAADARRDGVGGRVWTWLAKDGRRLRVHLSMTAVRDEGGAEQGFVVMGWAAATSAEADGDAAAAGPAEGSRRPALMVVAENRPITERLTRALSDRFEVTSVGSCATAIAQAPTARPDAIVLDMGLGGGDALDFRDRVAADASLARAPIVLFDSQAGAADEAGGPAMIDWLLDLDDPEELARTVARLHVGSEPPDVVVVDDSESRRQRLTDHLGALGVRCRAAEHPQRASVLVRATEPDLIVFHMEPSSAGLRLVDMLCRSCSRSASLLAYSTRDLTSEDGRSFRLTVTRRLVAARATERGLEAAVGDLVVELMRRGRWSASRAARSVA